MNNLLKPIKNTVEPRKFYVCSRVKHADRWRAYRARGANIISTWIDEAGVGETADYVELWERIEDEILKCDALVMLLEPDDFPLKGALVEAGMAIAFGKTVYLYAPDVILEGITFRPVGSWIKHPCVQFITNLDEIFNLNTNRPEDFPSNKFTLVYLQLSNTGHVIATYNYQPTRTECDNNYSKYFGQKFYTKNISKFNSWVELWQMNGSKLIEAVEPLEDK